MTDELDPVNPSPRPARPWHARVARLVDDVAADRLIQILGCPIGRDELRRCLLPLVAFRTPEAPSSRRGLASLRSKITAALHKLERIEADDPALRWLDRWWGEDGPTDTTTRELRHMQTLLGAWHSALAEWEAAFDRELFEERTALAPVKRHSTTEALVLTGRAIEAACQPVREALHAIDLLTARHAELGIMRQQAERAGHTELAAHLGRELSDIDARRAEWSELAADPASERGPGSLRIFLLVAARTCGLTVNHRNLDRAMRALRA
jgi:hypothetical protein